MFRETITVGRPFGIRVDVSLTWILVCALITWSLASFYFPLRFPSWGAPLAWFAAVVGSLLFFLSVVAHELAHALLALSLGVQVRSISLFLFGGMTQFRRDAPTPRADLLIALAGPLLNLVIGVVFFGVYVLVDAQSEVFGALCIWVGSLNLALGLFNLLPWLPLDGGRVLRGLAWFASDDRKWANRVALLAGQLGAVALFFAGVSMLVTQQGGVITAVWVMLVGWFVHSSAVASYQTGVLTAVLDSARVDALMVRRLGRIERDSAEAQHPTSTMSFGDPDYYVVTHEGRDVGVFSMSGLQESTPSPSSEARPESALSVLDVIVPVHQELALQAGDSAMDALRMFIERNLQWIPVVHDGEVVGVIRRLDLAEFVDKHRS